MAVLPGIDANDEAKTAAVFQFYTAVLSSIPALHGLAEEDDEAGMSPHGPAAAGDAGFGDFGAGREHMGCCLCILITPVFKGGRRCCGCC